MTLARMFFGIRDPGEMAIVRHKRAVELGGAARSELHR